MKTARGTEQFSGRAVEASKLVAVELFLLMLLAFRMR